LAELAKVLKPGGKLILKEEINSNGLRTENEIFLALTAAGFVDIKTTSSTEENGKKVVEVRNCMLC
jgi:hypothetical protein